MFEYTCGKKLTDEKILYYKKKLIKIFAKEYNPKMDRMWCNFKAQSKCLEFGDARQLKIPNSNNLLMYLEREDLVFRTTFKDICRYVDELEPWEDIDNYIFDDTFTWIMAITHEDLKCVVVGLT